MYDVEMGKRQQREIAELKAEVKALRRIIGRNDPKDLVESVITGITPLVLGYRDAPKSERERLTEILTGMGAQGLDETAGVERGVWFPDVEFDESMEAPERWPEPGTISGTTRTTQRITRESPNTTGHQMTPNGVERTDGQQMFTAGTTGPPPDSAIE